ncbi:hypothetical protein FQA47_012518 [Oryzias melastigma]|uniref:Uncharacterized protein n=1 Tax=Oryzias melastigma TaxID=30732 RepID=A0A834FJB4_ORYME|nr:hypothetical protein FQA47_012518 [Oryzias melastigma]
MLQHVQQGNVEPSRKVTPPSRLAKDRLALWPSQMISSCRGRRLHCMLQPPQKKAAEQEPQLTPGDQRRNCREGLKKSSINASGLHATMLFGADEKAPVSHL